MCREKDLAINPVATAYDDASTWYGSLFDSGRMRLLQQINIKILEDLMANADPLDVLDGGGGAGDYAIQLATWGHRVTCIDLSPGMVELAERKWANMPSAPQVSFRVGNLQALVEFSDASFDFVLLEGGTLSYLTDPAASLREVARVLRPHGRALITAQNTFHFMKLAGSLNLAAFIYRRSRVPNALNDVAVVTRCFTPAEFFDLLEQSGLKVERLGSKLVSTEILAESSDAMNRGDANAMELACSFELDQLWNPSLVGVGRSLMALCRRAAGSSQSIYPSPFKIRI